MLQILLHYQMVKSYLSYRADWYRLDWERIFILGEIFIIENHRHYRFHMSVCQSRSDFRLIIVYKGKKLFTHIRVAEHCNHS
jgi:hypothetical protein